VSVDVNANSDASTEAVISVPDNYAGPYSRVAIALDVMADSKYLGQIAEAVVDLPVKEG
jgi:hypothetical protein